jgi:hypothetical protein
MNQAFHTAVSDWCAPRPGGVPDMNRGAHTRAALPKRSRGERTRRLTEKVREDPGFSSIMPTQGFTMIPAIVAPMGLSRVNVYYDPGPTIYSSG